MNSDIRELSWLNLKNLFTKTYVKVYVPLSMVSWALEYRLVGLEPFLYFFDNLLLHGAVSVLVFAFALRLGLSRPAAFLGAMLFGVHPIHVESVAWATERKDVLFAVFYLLALIQYLTYLDQKRKSSYAFTILLGILSILAKPSALSLPFALGALDYYRGRRIDWRFVADKLPFFLYIIPIASLTFFRHSDANPMEIPGETLSEAIPIFFFTFSFYLQKFFFPLRLIPYYQLPPPISMAHAPYLAAAGIFALTGWLIVRWRRNRLFIFTALFFLGTIFFMVRYGTFVRYSSVVADRFIYISSVGLCIFVGQFLFERLNALGQKKDVYRRIGVTLLAALYLLLAIKTFNQCKIWKDSVTYWSYALKTNPLYAKKAYVLRANAYVTLENWPAALEDSNQALRLDAANGEAYAQRGAIYDKMGYGDLALADLNKALELNHHYSPVYVNRAGIYIERGEFDLAMADSNRALELGGSEAKAYTVRGKAYGAKGEYKKAIEDLTRAISFEANEPIYFYDRGYFYSRLGEIDKAIADYSKALEIDPQDYLTMDQRGSLYYGAGQFELALADFNNAIMLNPQYARSYNNRGSAFLAKSQWQNALADFNKAITLDKDYALAYLNRSVTHQQLGHKAEALEDAHKARSLGAEVDEVYINELLTP
jgi:tetratricopeptide (TPR) repeat protein